MNLSARPSRLLPALAVAAVAIVALCAAAAHWSTHAAAPDASGVLQARRPAADAPVHVVKAPPGAGAML